MSVTVVSGVPGVGSSRVTEAAVASLDEQYELLNTGDVLLEEALGSGFDVSGRDDLADLRPRELRRLQRLMGEYVAAIASEPETHVVLNTHLVVTTAAGFVPGLPPEVLTEVDPNAFVLVEADPDVIRDRRTGSDYRSYRVDDRLGIEFQQSMSRTAAFAYATSVGAPIALVENTDDVESAAARLSREIETASTR
ncbi:adenylate kinase [Salinigranum marinum]|uniref:adenylate kinase n=1 Tax=Salinigranum marinum TaxID=1515595 RepID=UPI00298A0434|nr:adenylate kinase [Salinigranum marinum]